MGTAFVFAMTLVLTGLANGFRVEARNTVNSFGIDYFLIQDGAAGPFLGSSPFAQTEVTGHNDFQAFRQRRRWSTRVRRPWTTALPGQ